MNGLHDMSPQEPVNFYDKVRIVKESDYYSVSIGSMLDEYNTIFLGNETERNKYSKTNKKEQYFDLANEMINEASCFSN